jgi:hypothetical protein
MGASFIAYKATVAVSGIVMLAPASLLDGEWQTDALPITGGSPGALMDGEWQTDALPITMGSPGTLMDGEWQADALSIVILAP